MKFFSGKMSSEGDDRSSLAPAEMNALGLSKRSRIKYSRASLVSLANLTAGKALPGGIEPSILCDLDFRLDGPLQGSYDSDSESCHENLHKCLLSTTENVGLLGPGSLLGAKYDIADASPPRVGESILHLLHKSKEPYRPPHLFKADWNDYKDEVWVSPEYLSKSGQKQNWRRDFPEMVREGKKELKDAFEKQKEISNEHDGNSELILPLEESEKIIDSLGPEHPDSTAYHAKSPATFCSEFAQQCPAIEEKPVHDISCTEGSESIAHGISNEHSTEVPDELLNSTTDGSKQLYGCKIPAVILGVLACVGLEDIFKPETTEFSCSMLWDGCDGDEGKQDSSNHHSSHQLLLVPESETEHKDTTASAKLDIVSDEIHPSDNKQPKLLSQGNAGQCETDRTGEPVYGTSFTKGQTEVPSCIRQSSVGRSTRKSVPETCKFFFPVANKNQLASAIGKYQPSVINSEDIVFSSSTNQSKGSENQSVADDLKPSPVCCSDEKDAFPLELCLPDEDSLITVDDFRVTYKDIVERNQVKADGVLPSPQVDTSGKPMDTKTGIQDGTSSHVYKSEAPVHQGKTPNCASPSLINSQVKAINPKFKPQNTSSRAFSTNVLPTTFHQPQSRPHQQLRPTLYTGGVGPMPPPAIYMQGQYDAQGFPWNFQMTTYGCAPVPTPGFQAYGGTNLLGTQSNVGTGYYRAWQ